jgi:uncharacterized protein (TIGR03083 family)
MNEAAMWDLIHAERARLVETLTTLSPEQWHHDTLCAAWNVQQTTGHILAGAEQTTGHFIARFAASFFRFNVMTGVDVQRLGSLSPEVLINRLRATVTTTNHPPAPIAAMLGEVVAHQEDICQPLSIDSGVADAALIATMEAFANTAFPLGSKKRIGGLTLTTSQPAWSHGGGPLVEGPAKFVMLAMVGRRAALAHLSGDGLGELTQRLN